MKIPSTLICLLAATLLRVPSALALILTSWELPENVSALEREYAANTNVVTVLALNRSAKDQSVTLLYQGSGGQLMAKSFGGDEFLSRFHLVKGGGGRSMNAGGRQEIHASDSLANYNLDTDTTWLGGNVGEGWSTPWSIFKEKGSTAEATFAENAMSLETESGTGEVIVGRTFAAPLAEGTMIIHAWQDGGVDFAGFAAYESGTEIIRWGVGKANIVSPSFAHDQGFVYSLDGGETYTLIFDESPVGSMEPNVDYTLTWNFLSGQPSFTLRAVDNLSEPFFETSISDGVTATSVTAVAAIATGDKRIAFSGIDITGTAIPEPCTLSLLLAGAALLSLRRRSR